MSDNTIRNPAPSWELIHGDALQVLRSYAPGAFDAVITDPPYASGGRTQAEKNKSTTKKYSSMGENAPPAFFSFAIPPPCSHVCTCSSL